MSLFCVGIAVVYFVEFEVSGLEQILLFMIMWCWTMWLQVKSYTLCSWWTASLGSILRHHMHVSDVNAVTKGGQSYYITSTDTCPGTHRAVVSQYILIA